MANAIAIARIVDLRRIDFAAREALRAVLVSGCALALIAAGRALPF